ncbi:hypothetical protein A2U01_0117745, partial [Trifolium medium]|nr:hypothetical protein [Trifolium medium]
NRAAFLFAFTVFSISGSKRSSLATFLPRKNNRKYLNSTAQYK